ncbi:hypothetical protein ASF17_03720 [Frigoribacterium sp. Leaf263]|uniref:hypothetical protein n=1 Tax=Frigoribacterium sp. Leaf263 TaxID=1736313 RepID=UPI0006FF8D06|nr:hypothetical protein [Frigoribacterium sp. Leaf263]KQO84594.1 hypothetical protein ASF17_03720 [Frigoribacterium sp. Leaf263]
MTITASAIRPVSSLADGDIRFDELARDQWRVVDARLPHDDATAVLGFVCVVAGLLEVTTLARPLEIEFCADERAARAVFLDALEKAQIPSALRAV